MDIQQLATIFSSTFDPNHQQEAEKRLDELKYHQGFVTMLVHLIMSNEIVPPVRQAACIYLKNMVVKYWKERDPNDFPDGDIPFVLPEQDKAFMREHLIDAVINAPDLIRVQLTVCISQMLRHDFPEKWPTVIDKVNLYLTSNNQATWMGALLTLYQIVKKYEFKKIEERPPIITIMGTMLPILYNHCVGLMNDDSVTAVSMQKQILKIFYSLIQCNMPLEIINEQNFPKWMQIFQTVVDRPVPAAALEPDEDERPRLAWWKAKKWALHILQRIFERYATPGSVSKEYSAFADYYCKNFAVSTTQIMLKVLDQYRHKVYIAPRVIQQTLNYLRNGVSNSIHWKVMRPHIHGIIQEVVFPLMCHTDEDQELWEDDPYDFIRVKYDIFEDFVSPVVAASTLLHTAVSKRKQVLDPTMAFCVQVLQLPPEQRDPRKKDGALHIIGTLADLLLKKKNYKDQLENMLVQHVFPEFTSPHGFIRARACWMLHVFGEIDFKNDANLAKAVEAARLCLTGDKEAPVKVEAAIALQFLITGQERAKTHIEPHVRDVIIELLKIIRETENDDLTSVMQKLISTYGDQEQVAGIAVDIAKELANTFLQLIEGEGDDERADERSVTAMGILNTVETMMHVLEGSKEIVHQLEQVCVTLIARVLQTSAIEFYEDVFSIINTCTCFEISQQMWTLYFMMYDAFEKDAFDFFAEMMPSLHNFITVDTPAFLANPKHVEIIYKIAKKMLTEDPGEDDQVNAAKLMEITILQCRGEIDQWVPFFVEAALERLTREVKGSELRTMCLQVAIAALYYNSPLLLSILEKLQFPNSQETVTAQFFSQWIHDADCFLGLHDRKMFVLGFCSLFDTPKESLPQHILHIAPRVIPSLLLVFAGLKRAYDYRGGEEEDSDDGDEELEEDELESDEDEINEDEVEYIENLAKKASDHLADEDEDDDEEETPLEGYTTAIDEESMDEYMAFKSTLLALQSRDPQWYAAMMNALTKEQNNELQQVFMIADQRTAAAESKRIEAQGGFTFQNVSVPSSFTFGQNSS
ncbi:importin-7-like [Actinia tenebrosa]|uniref:Importin-7-like n=1 Tax=Actinia tenebrosa TaxID=6105 RepID=A0A6P8HDM3_ACTTE|nr:importin-7-like [Actinia tenebrosa]